MRRSPVAGPVNLGIRFLVELGAYASLASWGAGIGGSVAVRASCALVAALVTAVVWSLWLAPQARWRLHDPAALVAELVIFATAAIALAASGARTAVVALALVATVSALSVQMLGPVSAAEPGGSTT